MSTSNYLRRLSLFDGTMVVVGGIIGAGIFMNPAVVAQRLDSSGLVLLVWMLGGLVALMGALCFGELGARRPEAGGGYVYLREAYGPLPAFLYGWTLLLVINTGGIAAVAMTFAFYAVDLFGAPPEIIKPLAIGVVVLLTGVNYYGIKPGSITTNIFGVLKLLAIAVLVVSGLAVFVQSDAGFWTTHTPVTEGKGLIASIGIALLPVLFAFGGWQQANHVAGEIAHPQRNLPRALLLGVLIVVACYVLVNLAALLTLGVGGLATSGAPASDVMKAAWGDIGGVLMSAGIAISTFGFVNLSILGGARVYQAMADDGLFFQRAAELHPKYHSPAFSLIVQGVWIVVLILSGSYGQLLDYNVFGDWIFFGLVVSTLFVFRRQNIGGTEPGYRMPGFPVLPVLFMAACAYAVVSSILSNPFNALMGTGLILLGVPVFWYWRSRVV